MISGRNCRGNAACELIFCEIRGSYLIYDTAAPKRGGVILFCRSSYGNLRPACGDKIMQYSSAGREEPRAHRRARSARLDVARG